MIMHNEYIAKIFIENNLFLSFSELSDVLSISCAHIKSSGGFLEKSLYTPS